MPFEGDWENGKVIEGDGDSIEISDFSGFPDSYIATIEIIIYYNPKTNYNTATGYTVFENVKTINLRATVHPTDR